MDDVRHVILPLCGKAERILFCHGSRGPDRLSKWVILVIGARRPIGGFDQSSGVPVAIIAVEMDAVRRAIEHQ